METCFAKINSENFVDSVLVANQAFIQNLPNASDYVQTWLNANGDPAKLYNYAGIGFTYDASVSAFIPPNPGSGFTLDTTIYQWMPTATYQSTQTLNAAVKGLQEITFLATPEIFNQLTPQSKTNVTNYISEVTSIAANAQIAIANDQAYIPVLPSVPSVVAGEVSFMPPIKSKKK
jgi:hypothetical protein